MTKKIFWEDPYLTELDTTITSVDGAQITVAETIFYAFSGGQESDSGTIGGYGVLNARKEEMQIFYTIVDNHQLRVGEKVKMTIDWNRRYKLMRLHFAAELVLELVCKHFPSLIKVGAHIAPDKARIDFQWDQKITSFIMRLEQEAQHIIDSNREIICGFSDEPKERRYWKIEGLSQVPCGGTHLKNTSEIGCLILKRNNPGKGKERIEIFVNDRT